MFLCEVCRIVYRKICLYFPILWDILMSVTYLCMPWISQIFRFDIPYEIPHGVAVAVFLGVWRLRRHTPLSCLSIDRLFHLFSPPFSALKFGSFCCFRVFSRLSLNSVKQGGPCRQERQEHLVHTAVFGVSLPSLSKFIVSVVSV